MKSIYSIYSKENEAKDSERKKLNSGNGRCPKRIEEEKNAAKKRNQEIRGENKRTKRQA
jgi:hypothetical protein